MNRLSVRHICPWIDGLTLSCIMGNQGKAVKKQSGKYTFFFIYFRSELNFRGATLRNISKTSASVSSGFPNTRKLMEARGRRPSAFVVFECLETPMKHEARVFEMASQSAPDCKQKKTKRTKESKNHISM